MNQNSNQPGYREDEISSGSLVLNTRSSVHFQVLRLAKTQNGCHDFKIDIKQVYSEISDDFLQENLVQPTPSLTPLCPSPDFCPSRPRFHASSAKAAAPFSFRSGGGHGGAQGEATAGGDTSGKHSRGW